MNFITFKINACATIMVASIIDTVKHSETATYIHDSVLLCNAKTAFLSFCELYFS